MSGRVPRDPVLDDWFDDPQPRAEGPAETAPAADDWLEGGGQKRQEERRVRLAVGVLRRRRTLVAAGAGAVVLLLLGLAVGGVFSGESSTSAPPATSAPMTTSTPTANRAAPAGPATTLKPGAKGAQVRALQQALAGLGYSPGKIDGSYGPATQKALASFQRASKLSPDGILGTKTLAALTKALGTSG
jgi:hypothetical protein